MKVRITNLVSILLFIFSSVGIIHAMPANQRITSPDGSYVFTFYQKSLPAGETRMHYTVSYKNKTVIEESQLGVLIENQLFESALAIPNDTCSIWTSNLQLVNKAESTIQETWLSVYGERNTISDHYNELTLMFQKGNNEEGEHTGGYDKRKNYVMNLIIRAYNEGVAFRYSFPETTNGLFLHIVGEQTSFTFPENTQAYYERWAQGPYSLLPLKNWTDECERPLTLKLANGLTVALAEAGLTDYTRMKFRLDETKVNTLRASLYGCADVITPYNTPWRVIMAAEKPVELIANNDIILNLNPPCRIEDTSWIKPGKVIRVAKMTQVDAMKCVDFAAERGLQYIHIDAGWYGPEMEVSSDATTVSANRDFDIPALTTYAQSKGIGLFVYVNQRALYQQLDELLPLYKKWGIKGIKFGFVQIGNQMWTTWLHDAVKKCAEYNMLVDIHDEYRPTGFSRTYPNLLTQEGVMGNEEMPDAIHNTTLPFTRYLTGAGDYTICYYNNRIKTTHAHQLALSVIYYSPLQFLYWYDEPSAYRGEPEIEFFDNVKTVWDDTRAISGEIGEYVAMARRSGNEWFIGGITNTSARTISIPTDFLEKGKTYNLRVYQDDETVKTRTQVSVADKNIKGGDRLTFQLKASGGVAIHAIPAF